MIPLLSCLGLLLLSFFGGKLLVKRVQTLSNKLSTSKKNERVLGQNLILLQEFSGQALFLSGSAAIALPAKNSALLTISQFKKEANSQDVILDNLKVSSEVKDKPKTISRVDIKFDVEGTLNSLINFLMAVKQGAPLTRIKKIHLSYYGEKARASVGLSSFWSSYPTMLPTLSQPLVELSTREREVLSILSSLNPPLFREVTPSPPSVRSNPFSFQ